MAIELRHISASSAQSFTECRRRWALRYDKDYRTDDSNVASERGTFLHKALEFWKDPARGYGDTYEELIRAFKDAARSIAMAESFEVYTTSFKMLEKAYQLSANHPYLPIDRTEIWGVEVRIENWRGADNWALPLLGFVDELSVVHSRGGKPKEVILVVGDYKSGHAKDKEELLSDVQPALYMAWAIQVVKPYLEACGYTVTHVMNAWTYIAHDTVEILTENDFDLDVIMDYVGNISQQMVAAAKQYNAVPVDERMKFLEKWEKRNQFCGWCVARNSCSQVKNALKIGAHIDLVATPLPELLAKREEAALAESVGKDLKKAIDKTVREHMRFENLDAVFSATMKYIEVKASNESWPTDAIKDAFGIDFILRAASITKEKIEKELKALKASDPDYHDRVQVFLQTRKLKSPGAQYLRGYKITEKK